jgi:hypothetical protein
MGRWAEVYFTSPPEKREQAVLELLRELEHEAPGEARGSVSEPSTVIVQESGTVQRSSEPAPMTEQIACPGCGEQNPASQRFCSNCGAPLRNRREGGDFASKEWTLESVPPAEFDFRRDTSRETSWAVDDDTPALFSNYQPVPYRFRLYVGIAITFVIGSLGYVAWRGTQGKSGSWRSLPQAAPAAQAEAPAPQQPSQSAPAATSAVENRAPENAPPASAPARAADANKAAENKPADEINSKRTPSSPAPATAPGEAGGVTASRGNGSEELVIAENYLNAKQGARDSSEAAKWLWKSMAKKNATAALMLSDLYLRGDGVAKNCDQARLLLDAAARKGVAGAGERIRNLQAFGCQ